MESQSYLLTKAVEVVGIVGGSSSQGSTYLQRAGQEDTRLETYHLDILFLGDIGAALEVHIELLSLANLQGCLGEDFKDGGEHGCRTLHHALIGQHEHGVAGENGLVGIPLPVHGGMSAAQVGIVHEVVVEKSVVMISLQSHGLHENLLRVVLEEVIG